MLIPPVLNRTNLNPGMHVRTYTHTPQKHWNCPRVIQYDSQWHPALGTYTSECYMQTSGPEVDVGLLDQAGDACQAHTGLLPQS